MKNSCLMIFLVCFLLIGSGCEHTPNSADPPSGDTASTDQTKPPEGGAYESASDLPWSGMLPPKVAFTHAALLSSARDQSFNKLQSIINMSDHFNYTFGPDHPGGAVGYWKEYRDSEDQPFERLVTLLQLEPTLRDSLYVWPSWMATPLDSLTDEEQDELAAIMGEEMANDMLEGLDYYLGWRTAIDLDGNWVYYVAGD